MTPTPPWPPLLSPSLLYDRSLAALATFDPGDAVVAAVYLAILCTLFGCGELLKRRWPVATPAAVAAASARRGRAAPTSFAARHRTAFDGMEAGRKLVHLLSGGFIAVLPYTGASWRAGALVGALSFLMLKLIGKAGLRGGALSYLLERRQGALTYSLSLVVMSVAVFDRREIFMISFMVLALADPAAAFVGMTRGRRGFLLKSWEGFLAHFGVALAVLYVFFAFGMGFSPRAAAAAAATVALGVSLIEGASAKGLDNLTIPLATAAGVSMALAAVG